MDHLTWVICAHKMRRMHEKLIPEHIDPFRFAEQGIFLEGTVKIADMQRLVTSLAGDDQRVIVSLQFGLDDQKTTFLKGHLETQLILQCQRCMESFSYEIISDFILGIVNSLEEADSLPEYYEPALAQGGQLALRDLIEDEIILNLPIIPRHDPKQCKVKLPVVDSGWEEANDKNPFYVLKSLKHKNETSKK